MGKGDTQPGENTSILKGIYRLIIIEKQIAIDISINSLWTFIKNKNIVKAMIRSSRKNPVAIQLLSKKCHDAG